MRHALLVIHCSMSSTTIILSMLSASKELSSLTILKWIISPSICVSSEINTAISSVWTVLLWRHRLSVQQKQTLTQCTTTPMRDLLKYRMVHSATLALTTRSRSSSTAVRCLTAMASVSKTRLMWQIRLFFGWKTHSSLVCQARAYTTQTVRIVRKSQILVTLCAFSRRIVVRGATGSDTWNLKVTILSTNRLMSGALLPWLMSNTSLDLTQAV